MDHGPPYDRTQKRQDGKGAVMKGVRPETGGTADAAEEEQDRCDDQCRFYGFDQLDRDQDGSLLEWEGLEAHFACGLETGIDIGRQILGLDRTVTNAEAGEFLDRVGGHARSPQLGEDQQPMADDLFQAARFDPSDQFLRTEGSLSGGAPDVDSLSVERQDPEIPAGQGAPQLVEAY